MACKMCGYDGAAFPCPNCWGTPCETTPSVRETTPSPESVVSQAGPVVSRQRAWKQRQGEAWRRHHAEYMRAYRGRYARR